MRAILTQWKPAVLALLLLLFWDLSGLIACTPVAAGTKTGAGRADVVAVVGEGDRVAPFKEAARCPVTQPPDPPFIPPQPWPARPPERDRFWFGGDDLWTALPVDGSWRQLALGEKFWWWSARFDVEEDTTPDLRVTARRLDGDAPVLQVAEATNGYHESFHWAMLTGVELASPGCWEFTGEYRGDRLSFVLWVPPA